MASWKEVDFENIKENLFSGHSHICFLIGSFVSAGHPSNCLTIKQVREELLFKPLLSLCGNDITPFINRFFPGEDLAQSINALPFEQFMGCFYEVEPTVAENIIKIAHGNNLPNSNHKAIAGLSKHLLTLEPVNSISILTTNYDLCLDTALTELFLSKEDKNFSAGIPAYEFTMENGKYLRYVKLHGCIEKKNSLVFTLNQMKNLIENSNWNDELINWLKGETELPTIVLSAGYGFWDADLYELIQNLSVKTVLYRNEHPNFRQEDDESLSGRGFLRNEFFDNLISHESATGTDKLRLFKSTLINDKKNSSSLLIDMYNAIPIVERKISCPHQENELTYKVKEATAACSLLTKEQISVFIAKLLNACELSEGCDLLKNFSSAKSDVNRIELAKAYLNTFGHTNELEKAIKVCESIRREIDDHNIKLLSYTYQFGALTIGTRTKASFVTALKVLGNAYCYLWTRKFIRKTFLEKLEESFKYSVVCFYMKIAESLNLASGDIILRIPLNFIARILVKIITKILIKKLRKMPFIHNTGGTQLMSGTEEILARLLILAGENKKAKIRANQVKKLWGFTGQINSAVQADRLLGWYYLSEGDQENRIEAIKCFACGLHRALKSKDTSLRQKLAVNLLRAIWAGNTDNLTYDSREKVTDETIMEICLFLQNLSPTNLIKDNIFNINPKYSTIDNFDEYIRQITAYALSFFASPQELIKEINRLSDLKRYPIYHSRVKVREKMVD
jgi:hypothetical protein